MLGPTLALAIWLALERLLEREPSELGMELTLDATVSLDHKDGSITATCQGFGERAALPPGESMVDTSISIQHRLGTEQVERAYYSSATVSDCEHGGCRVELEVWPK